MAAEEFQESDIIFSDHDRDLPRQHHFGFKEMDRQNTSNRRGNKKMQKKSTSSSLPVNIPSNVFQLSDGDEFAEEFEGDELIPPHVIVGRRIEGKMAFSVCTGNGRTLKGRDLSHVRNSILRLTGFLET
ncbi:uncharacterized protein LOC110601313 [Manihot esculenta]|uniref:Senescence regulator n=1 Tax=Manihot esculenta TaxID=3983 RepID=A0A2C9UG22_MANES|nr:uncharacterized protein LOC110601313 [Manihot esculenta]OAY29074.1 hypothetical protein MANES_15G116100v8 [Manihot esculenta]